VLFFAHSYYYLLLFWVINIACVLIIFLSTVKLFMLRSFAFPNCIIGPSMNPTSEYPTGFPSSSPTSTFPTRIPTLINPTKRPTIYDTTTEDPNHFLVNFGMSIQDLTIPKYEPNKCRFGEVLLGEDTLCLMTYAEIYVVDLYKMYDILDVQSMILLGS